MNFVNNILKMALDKGKKYREVSNVHLIILPPDMGSVKCPLLLWGGSGLGKAGNRRRVNEEGKDLEQLRW
jgi:hypothetical protein